MLFIVRKDLKIIKLRSVVKVFCKGAPRIAAVSNPVAHLPDEDTK